MASPPPNRTIDHEIKAYEAMQLDLEEKFFGLWVVIAEGTFIGSYADFQQAANNAVEKFGRGPYLIRQVGEKEITIPASIAYSIGV